VAWLSRAKVNVGSSTSVVCVQQVQQSEASGASAAKLAALAALASPCFTLLRGNPLFF
jgi:hypothetical protein